VRVVGQNRLPDLHLLGIRVMVRDATTFFR
jgi:hypothetical protein